MNEFVLLGAFGVLIPSLASWRAALLLALCTGFAQDVVRKLTPGEPVALVLLFAPVFALAGLGILVRGGSLSLGPMFRLHPRLLAPVSVFLCVVAVQVAVALANTGSAMVASIGVMVYVLPFVALVVAMYYASSVEAIALALKIYIACSALFSLGVYLNVLGYQDGILDSVGAGLYIYPPEGGVLKLPSGFFRTPETAAWHAATAAALAAVLVMTRLFPGGSAAGVLVIAVLAGAVLLTGRRKMFVELCVFASVYAAMLAFHRGRGLRLAVLLGSLVVLVYLGQLLFVPEQSTVNVRSYVSRYDTVAEEAVGRLRSTTVDSAYWVVQRNGWLGAGAGTASQGAAQFSAGAKLVGYSAEGGVGKVLAELGVHGFAAALWVLCALAVSANGAVRRLHTGTDWRRATLATGLAALLLSNVLVFATAAQVFGDPFVLLMLGLMLGFVLRTPSCTGRDA